MLFNILTPASEVSEQKHFRVLDRLPVSVLPKCLHGLAPRVTRWSKDEGALIRRYCIATQPHCKHTAEDNSQGLGGHDGDGKNLGKLECHEVFSFFTCDSDRVLYPVFEGVVVLCPMCHFTQHIMRAYTVNPKEYNKRMIEKYCYSYMICKEEFAQEQSKAVEEYQNFADFEMGGTDGSKADQLLADAINGNREQANGKDSK